MTDVLVNHATPLARLKGLCSIGRMRKSWIEVKIGSPTVTYTGAVHRSRFVA